MFECEINAQTSVPHSLFNLFTCFLTSLGEHFLVDGGDSEHRYFDPSGTKKPNRHCIQRMVIFLTNLWSVSMFFEEIKEQKIESRKIKF